MLPQVALLLVTSMQLGHSTTSSSDSPHLQYMTWYGCIPAEQHTFSNLCIEADNAVLLEARSLGMHGMKSVTWAFFMNAVYPRTGLMLRPDYQAGWADMWHGSGSLSALSANQTVMGVFLGCAVRYSVRCAVRLSARCLTWSRVGTNCSELGST
jgi:hypothetical protein